MNVDQLFKALPRDLLWEVLSEFVGSHSVRKGKLIKKLVFDNRHQMLLDRPLISQEIGIQYDTFGFYAETAVIMSNGRYLAVGLNPGKMDELMYGFRKILPGDDDLKPWLIDIEITRLNDSVLLPLFEKHSYPSCPFTNKKKNAFQKN